MNSTKDKGQIHREIFLKHNDDKILSERIAPFFLMNFSNTLDEN